MSRTHFLFEIDVEEIKVDSDGRSNTYFYGHQRTACGIPRFRSDSSVRPYTGLRVTRHEGTVSCPECKVLLAGKPQALLGQYNGNNVYITTPYGLHTDRQYDETRKWQERYANRVAVGWDPARSGEEYVERRRLRKVGTTIEDVLQARAEVKIPYRPHGVAVASVPDSIVGTPMIIQGPPNPALVQEWEQRQAAVLDGSYY